MLSFKDYTQFDRRQDVEIELFKDLSTIESPIDTQEYKSLLNQLSSLFDTSNFRTFKVFHKTDDKIIITRHTHSSYDTYDFIIIDNDARLKDLVEGETYISFLSRGEFHISITNEFKELIVDDVRHLKFKMKYFEYPLNHLNVRTFLENPVFTMERFTELFDEIKNANDLIVAKKEKEIKEIADRLLAKKEDAELLKVSNNRKITYGAFTVFENQLTYGSTTIKTTKNVKDLFTPQELKEISDSDDHKRYLVEKFVSLKEDYEVIGSYKINFKSRGVTLNGVDMPVWNIFRIIKNLSDEDLKDVEKIKAFKNLSVMKNDLINLEQISINSYNNKIDNIRVPVNVTIIDTYGNNFKVEMLGKSTDMKWDDIKSIFFKGRNLYRRFEFNIFEELFTKKIGATREEMFNVLRKLSIIKNLGSSD